MKNRIVTIAARNLKPGDTFISKVGGCWPKTLEHKVLTVFRKEWPDRINVGFTYQDGDRVVNWEFKPWNLIQVRRTGDQSFTLDLD